jgi:hypothetical protein
MNLLGFYASLRRDLLAVMRGVENARGTTYTWDDTTPNYITKRKLGEINQKYIGLAATFGFFVVTRHSECGNSNHATTASYGYVMDSIGGNKIDYRDPRFYWQGGQMYHGEKMCRCPCSAENEPTAHHIIEDILYDVAADLRTCQMIEAILYDVDSAIASAGAWKVGRVRPSPKDQAPARLEGTTPQGECPVLR